MKPIQTEDTNVVFTLDGCGDLPAVAAHDENGINYVITAWEVTPDDLKKLNETGILYVSVMGTSVPPMALEVDNPLIPNSEGGADNGL